jgi:hypothetical protein
MRRLPSVCRAARETSRRSTPLEVITEEPLASDNPLAAAGLGAARRATRHPPLPRCLYQCAACRCGSDFWIKRRSACRFAKTTNFAPQAGRAQRFRSCRRRGRTRRISRPEPNCQSSDVQFYCRRRRWRQLQSSVLAASSHEVKQGEGPRGVGAGTFHKARMRARWSEYWHGDSCTPSL